MRKLMLVMATIVAVVPLAIAGSADAQSVRACVVKGTFGGTATLSEPVFGSAALSWEGTLTGVETCTGTGASMRFVDADVSASGFVHATTLQGVTNWDGEVDITVSDPGRGTSTFKNIGVTGDGGRWTSVGGTVRLFGSRQIALTIVEADTDRWSGPVAYH